MAPKQATPSTPPMTSFQLVSRAELRNVVQSLITTIRSVRGQWEQAINIAVQRAVHQITNEKGRQLEAYSRATSEHHARQASSAAVKQLETRFQELSGSVKDGHTPTRSELFALIQPLVPTAKDIKGLVNDADRKEAIAAQVSLRLPKMGKAIRQALTQLEGENRLPVDAIHGLDERLTTVVKGHLKTAFSGYGQGGGTSFALLQSGTEKVQQPHALNFTGAGAPTITHRQSGVTDLSFPSGSGTPVSGEVVSGSGTTFTVAHIPKSGTLAVFGRGQRITNFSLSSATITTTDTWSPGDIVADYYY